MFGMPSARATRPEDVSVLADQYLTLPGSGIKLCYDVYGCLDDPVVLMVSSR